MPTFVALRYRAILPIPHADASFDLPVVPPIPALEAWEPIGDGVVPWSSGVRLEAVPGVPRTLVWVECVVRLGVTDNPRRTSSPEVERMLEQLGVTGRIVARQTYSDAERLRPGVLALRSVDPGDGPAAPGLQETDPRGLRDALDALARRHPHPRVLALLELANWW